MLTKKREVSMSAYINALLEEYVDVVKEQERKEAGIEIIENKQQHNTENMRMIV